MSRLLPLLLLFFSIPSFSQNYHIQENFNTSALPTGWTNSAIVGSNTWSFGIDASAGTTGNNNLNGTPQAFFDDDILGLSGINTVHLITPSFNNSSSSSTYLEFDYNFRQFSASIPDSFKVEVYDGTHWIMVFSRTFNDCGDWLATFCVGNFPHAIIDISPYTNSNCQVRFIYYDGGDWCWFVAIDNVEIYDPTVTDLESPHSPTLAQTLTLYPNPNNGSFKVSVPEKFIGVEYQIIDLNGKLVKSDKFSSSIEQMDLELEQGIYFLRVPEKGINEKIVLF